ncbi:hypothetical protein IPL68_04015 [Candidatus Saccharibacteria bacterium]|nr:MAG: hypothetical protein IPL68_04015 [Candidatus Saccharibacteria bacterium]
MSEFTAPTPEFGSRPEDLAAFNETVATINEHNDQFSLGKLMARAMIDHVGEAQKAQELMDAGATQEEAEQTAAFVGSDKLPLSEEEQMARSIVGITNAPVLESTGLTLSPLRKTSTMYGPQGEQSVGKVRLQVTDGGKFSTFLLAVNPEDANEDFQHSAAGVAGSVIAEAKDAISGDADEHTVLETLAYGKGIVAGLEHIGLGESPVTVELTSLYEHAQQGDVREYVNAGNVGLLTEPEEQGFGPASWQRDASPDFLAEHWNKVLDVVKAAKANPKATELFAQLVKSAQTSLDYAKADWAKLKTEDYGGGGEYGKGFEQIFETVGLELSMVASPDEESK